MNIEKGKRGKKIKMMNREEMLNEIIRRRGFEDEYTIKFARMAETIADINILRLEFAVLMSMTVMDEE